MGHPALRTSSFMGHPATGHPALTDIQLFGHPTLPDIQLYRTSSSSGHPALSDIQLYQISSSIGHPTLSDIQHYQNFHLFQTSSSIEHPAGRHQTVENHQLGLFFTHNLTEWTVTERHMIRYIILMQVLKLWQVVKSLQMCTKHYQYFK